MLKEALQFYMYVYSISPPNEQALHENILFVVVGLRTTLTWIAMLAAVFYTPGSTSKVKHVEGYRTNKVAASSLNSSF